MCLFVNVEVVLLSGAFASLTSGQGKCNLVACLKWTVDWDTVFLLSIES